MFEATVAWPNINHVITVHSINVIRIMSSLGISEAEIEGQIQKSERQYRLEAIHIRGFDGSIVSSEDIHEYFSEFSPVSFEWVDKNSANVIWALPSSAAKALLTLSRPLKEVSINYILMIQDQKITLTRYKN